MLKLLFGASGIWMKMYSIRQKIYLYQIGGKNHLFLCQIGGMRTKKLLPFVKLKNLFPEYKVVFGLCAIG